MFTQLPIHPLRPFISHYWLSLENVSTVHPILPDGCIDAVFEMGRTTGIRIYGAATHLSSCLVLPGNHYLGICFRPGQIRHFLKIPSNQFTDKSEEIKSLAGLRPEVLADEIVSGSVFQSLNAALASWLESQLPVVNPVDQALHTIDRYNGNVRIDTVAAELHLSPRQVERRFLDAVGMSPKTYANIRRLHQALNQLRSQPTISLATVALDAGYADQSHMNRSFLRLLGRSPQAAVAFVQDELFPADYIARVS